MMKLMLTVLRRGLIRRQRGQATVEFALICMTIFVFLVGTLDLGRGVYYYNVLAKATRDGARYASMVGEFAASEWQTDGNAPGTYASAAPYAGTNTVVGVTTKHIAGLDLSQLQVTIDAPMGTGTGMQLPITVIGQYGYHPVAGTLLGIGSITIQAESTMRIS